jgi:hypothetical protein
MGFPLLHLPRGTNKELHHARTWRRPCRPARFRPGPGPLPERRLDARAAAALRPCPVRDRPSRQGRARDRHDRAERGAAAPAPARPPAPPRDAAGRWRDSPRRAGGSPKGSAFLCPREAEPNERFEPSAPCPSSRRRPGSQDEKSQPVSTRPRPSGVPTKYCFVGCPFAGVTGCRHGPLRFIAASSFGDETKDARDRKRLHRATNVACYIGSR